LLSGVVRAHHCHWVRKEDCGGNHDSAPFLGDDDCGARLNVVDASFDSSDANPIAGSKRVLQKDQNACEKVLKYILEGEADSYRCRFRVS
jgi:hypothetical protein